MTVCFRPCIENATVNLNDKTTKVVYNASAYEKEEGAQQKAIEAAINLIKMKLGTPEQIAQAQGLPLQKVLELKEEIRVKV